MEEREEVLKTLERMKEEISARYKVKRIGLFGSFGRREQRENSDIDLLVEFQDDADLIDFVGLGLFLEEKLHRKVDVVPETALKHELRAPILKEAVFV